MATSLKEEAGERFTKEALASWTAYQETGRHLTGEEARAWLDTWGTDDETPAPQLAWIDAKDS